MTMMTTSRAGAQALALLLAVSLVGGCKASEGKPSTDQDGGKAKSSQKARCLPRFDRSNVGDGKWPGGKVVGKKTGVTSCPGKRGYYLEVKTNRGKVSYGVSKGTYRACSVGEPFAGCTTEGRAR